MATIDTRFKRCTVVTTAAAQKVEKKGEDSQIKNNTQQQIMIAQ